MIDTAAVNFFFKIFQTLQFTDSLPWIGNQLSDKIEAFDMAVSIITSEPYQDIAACFERLEFLMLS